MLGRMLLEVDGGASPPSPTRVAREQEEGLGGGRGSLCLPLPPASDARGLCETCQLLSAEKWIILQAD